MHSSLAADVINEAHDTLMDPPEKCPPLTLLQVDGSKHQNVVSLCTSWSMLRHDSMSPRAIERGRDVTIHHPSLRRQGVWKW